MSNAANIDLTEMAPLMNPLRYQPDAEPRYDLLSDAVIWSDELPTHRPPHEWWNIRYLLHHRTCEILGKPSPHQNLWEAGLMLFPNWPGFREDRCTPSDALRAMLLRCMPPAK